MEVLQGYGVGWKVMGVAVRTQRRRHTGGPEPHPSTHFSITLCWSSSFLFPYFLFFACPPSPTQA